ncbi:MAG: ABC transporter ATP-binding protein [Alphaproteobacteria bacterium]|nr:ABC transporter ATP-binding protein [Alphaproteobacteria bacterium]
MDQSDAGLPPGVGVRLRGIRMAYAGAALFDGLDLDLAGGSWTCLLGPSGSGKTTLLRLVAGLAAPSAGTIADGAGAPLAGRVAWMGQTDLLFPWLSVLDNATIGARLRGRSADAAVVARARDLLGRVGLGGRTGDRPAVLSGGMRQRAALVRTLMEDKAIVLMDEPFSALDAITRVAMQDLAFPLLRGRTVLLVTHDPLEALRLGDRILVVTGFPAQLSEPVALPPHPPGAAAPRPLDDQRLLALQGELLAGLARTGSGDA